MFKKLNKRTKEYETCCFRLFTLKRCIDKAIQDATIDRRFNKDSLNVEISIPFTRRESVKIIFPIDLVSDY